MQRPVYLVHNAEVNSRTTIYLSKSGSYTLSTALTVVKGLIIQPPIPKYSSVLLGPVIPQPIRPLQVKTLLSLRQSEISQEHLRSILALLFESVNNSSRAFESMNPISFLLNLRQYQPQYSQPHYQQPQYQQPQHQQPQHQLVLRSSDVKTKQ